MNRIIYPLVALFVGLLLTACSQTKTTETTSAETQTDEQTSEQTAQNCRYSYNEADLSVFWTAYKFTEKTGVNGKFKTATVIGDNEQESVVALLTGLTFEIPIESLDTNDPERDKKIRNHFFGTLTETTALRGTFRGAEGDNNSGKATIILNMNNMDKEFSLNYTIDEENNLRLKGDIDVSLWEAVPAINALNEVCKDLHTGADGVSKLWSEVSLSISVPIIKKCE
jgi:polyisoprenoid-binding protein YceI